MGKLLEIKDIERDPALQPRAAMDEGTVAEYTEALQDEERVEAWPFPAVEVVWDGAKYWLWDGFHRVAAAVAAGILRVPANVGAGNREYALWRSTGANKTHGLRRSNADKRRATEQALLAAPDRSDREIAYHVGVSAPTVGKIRKELEADCKFLQSTERTGADGRTINTAKIGKALTALPQPLPKGGEEEANDRQFATCPRCNVATLEPGGVKKACGVCGWPEREKSQLSRFPTYIGWLCPQCQGKIRKEGESLWCEGCGAIFWLENGQLSMVNSQPQPPTPDPHPLTPTGQFDCPYCFDERVVHVNGGAWCMSCGVKWASVESFKLDYKNYQEQQQQQAHERNLRALEAAAGSEEAAQMVLEMERVYKLQKQAVTLFNRVLDTTIIEDLEALIALLEDFEMDTPKEG